MHMQDSIPGETKFPPIFPGLPSLRTRNWLILGLTLFVMWIISRWVPIHSGYVCDFLINWDAANSFFHGGNPYTFPTYYPPGSLMLFGLFTIYPREYSFAIWLGFNIIFLREILLNAKLTRQFIPWLLFPPVSFMFISGQIDLFLVWLGLNLQKKNWMAVAAAVVIVLKPQIAFILLPWVFIRDFRLGLLTLAFSVPLHLSPLLVNPNIYTLWMAATTGAINDYLANSPGIFALSNLGIPVAVLAVLAFALIVWGLRQPYTISKTVLLSTLPFGIWYNGVVLTGAAPWWFLVPIGWCTFIVSALLQSSLPMAVIPLAALLYLAVGRFNRRPAREAGLSQTP